MRERQLVFACRNSVMTSKSDQSMSLLNDMLTHHVSRVSLTSCFRAACSTELDFVFRLTA